MSQIHYSEHADDGQVLAVTRSPMLLQAIPFVMAILAFIIWKRMRANQQTHSERAFSHVRDTISSSDMRDGPRGMLLNAVDHVESAAGAVAHAAAGAASTVSDQLNDQSKRLRK